MYLLSSTTRLLERRGATKRSFSRTSQVTFKAARRPRSNNDSCRTGAAAAQSICAARASYRATRHSIAASTNTAKKKKNLQRQFRTRLLSSTTPVFPNTRNHLGLSPRHLITLATHSLVCAVSCLFSLPPRVSEAGEARGSRVRES